MNYLTSFKKNLDSEGICTIIKSCADNGVTEFSLGPLVISFGPRKIKPVFDPEWLHPESDHESDPEEILEKDIEENIVKTPEDIVEDKAEELAFMALEDPEAFEELLANRPETIDDFGDQLGIVEKDDAETEEF